MYIFVILIFVLAVILYVLVNRVPKDVIDRQENARIANKRMEEFNARLDRENQQKENWY